MSDESGEWSGDAVVFHFRLPFSLPLADDRLHVFDGYKFAEANADEPQYPPVVALQLYHIEVAAPPVQRPGFIEGLERFLGKGAHDAPEPKFAEGPFFQTWVEATTAKRPFHGESNFDAPTTWIERCLADLNRLIRAYQVVSGDPSVHPVSIVHLDPVLPLSLLDARTRERRIRNLVVLHMNFAVPTPPLPSEREDLVYAHVHQERHGHPFVIHRDWLERAKFARRLAGDYANAVNCLQTSVETLLWSLLRSILVDCDFNSQAIAEDVARVRSFANLVKRRLPEALGVTWDVSGPESPEGRYWHSLYLLRCRIVHEGYLPTVEDMGAAFAGYDALIELVIGIVVQRRTEIPRTAVALLGRPGLEKRMAYDDEMKKIAARLAKERHPFWLPRDVAHR